MSDGHDQTPPPDSPPLNGFGRPARRRGAAPNDAMPRMETVRVTAPDLERRKVLEKARGRLVMAALGFVVLFLAVFAKLTDATIFDPLLPRPAGPPIAKLLAPLNKPIDLQMTGQRANILDRNGQILAISLPTVSVYADPRQIIDPVEAANQLKQVLPQLDLAEAVKRLKMSDKEFVWLARKITPREQAEVNELGIPGVNFLPSEERDYPMGRLADHVLGGVDVDEQGIAGVEKWFNKRMLNDPNPLRLSLDVRIEGIVRDELDKAMTEFQAKGACGIVMNANTGEVLAMVSLPDYNANDFRAAPAETRFNRCVSGVYEPGSTFKLQTSSMALNDGVIHIWDEFDAAHPIHIGRYTITDFEGKLRWLYLPEVLAYSSNLGAAHIATLVGAERQRAWLRMMGMFVRSPIQLPEAAPPIIHPKTQWRLATTMTVGFGQGIAVEPMQLVRGTAAVATGVLYKPTLLAIPPGEQPQGERVLKPATMTIMRKLMRLVVTNGFGTKAEVAGYYPGGKTGTSEVVGKHGYHHGTREHFNVSAFVCAFPMNNPQYVVYIMLDEPHGNKSTYGFATAGMVSAPAAGRVIARIGPILGLLPDIKDAPEINAELGIPLQPGRPPGAFALGPWNENIVEAAEHTPLGFRPDMPADNATAKQTPAQPRTQRDRWNRPSRMARDLHRASDPVEAGTRRVIGARVLPAFAEH